ncbi:histidine triad nucleotide-binding protein [Patescibacteria group bacterium]|nr:histidine triad nucleotide-binding protein [Patescibacteria group bacterium]MCL5797563.1 histidine triad nucleotide-binding protein [Patescibacteria group bacterium]
MDDCIFCKIIKGEIPSKKVFEDKDIVAFNDINPKAPVHVLVVPKKHIESLANVDAANKDLLGKLLIAVSEIARKTNVDKSGYKVVANNGEGAGQLVLHLHFHILGGWMSKPHWQV